MQPYDIVFLKDVYNELGEEHTKKILSQFSCPLNLDVEGFLFNNAIEFDKQGIARTYLVFMKSKTATSLLGYFTLANKNIVVKTNNVSKTLKKRISKFSVFEKDLRAYRLSAPLIAQIGKNYKNGYEKLISGDELLFMACERVAAVQELIGGKIVYLECENKQPLVSWYQSNGFVTFGSRLLDPDEEQLMEGKYLVQMLKYMK